MRLLRLRQDHVAVHQGVRSVYSLRESDCGRLLRRHHGRIEEGAAEAARQGQGRRQWRTKQARRRRPRDQEDFIGQIDLDYRGLVFINRLLCYYKKKGFSTLFYH